MVRLASTPTTPETRRVATSPPRANAGVCGLLRTAVLLALVLITGCATWQPTPLAIPDALLNMQTQTRGDVTVSTAILTDEQALLHFGIDFAALDMQAIWLRIRNDSPDIYWLLRNAVDPDYYSPDEVARMAAGAIAGQDQAAVDQYLRDESIRVKIPAHTEVEGFLYTPKAIGGRYIDVRLGEDIYTVRQAQAQGSEDGRRAPPQLVELRFGFAVPLPDGIFDYERLDAEKTYEGQALPNLDSDAFRAALEALPCCAANGDGEAEGDPLNLVIVAQAGHALNALSRAGWSFTHRITFESVRRLAGAAIQGTPYPVAPVSDLYLFERKQDFALQRARTTIAQRNHLRVWLAPFRYRNLPVWIGQVSRDIGVKLTPDSPSLTTHVIDPEVDLTREYFLDSLLAEGFVQAFGFSKGSRAASREAPAENLGGDPYFSDGLRLVVVLSRDPVPYSEIESLLWEQSAAPVAEGQSEAAADSVRSLEQ